MEKIKRNDNENENLLDAAAFSIIFDHACFMFGFFCWGENNVSTGRIKSKALCLCMASGYR